MERLSGRLVGFTWADTTFRRNATPSVRCRGSSPDGLQDRAEGRLSLWLDVAFGILLAIVLTVSAEFLSRYAEVPARRVPCKVRPRLEETSAAHSFSAIPDRYCRPFLGGCALSLGAGRRGCQQAVACAAERPSVP